MSPFLRRLRRKSGYAAAEQEGEARISANFRNTVAYARDRAGSSFSAVKLWALWHPLSAFLILAPVLGLATVGVRGITPSAAVGFLDSIAGGVLASLATYALVQYYFLQRESFGTKSWLGFDSAPTWIIPTYLSTKSARYPGEDYYLVPPFDAQAAGVATDLLRKAGIHHPTRRVTGSHRFVRDVLRDNLVMLCLPERNCYTRVFLGIYYQLYEEGRSIDEVITDDNVRAFLEDDGCKHNYFGMRHLPSSLDGQPVEEWQLRNLGAPADHDWYYRSSVYHDGTLRVHRPGRPIFDYCLILKGPNPFNPVANILIVCGIHGVGTLGGMLYLYEQASDLFARFPDRAQVHLVKVSYAIKIDATNYIDADIVSKTRLGYDALNEALFWRDRPRRADSAQAASDTRSSTEVISR